MLVIQIAKKMSVSHFDKTWTPLTQTSIMFLFVDENKQNKDIRKLEITSFLAI